MATRTPVYFDGTDIVDMTPAQLENIYNYAKYLYSLNPTVTLSYTASSGNIGTINDTRQQSGSTAISTTSFPTSSAQSGYNQVGVNPITVSNARINQNRTALSLSVDSDNIKFPMYRDASNDLVAMTDSDFIDTFCVPALRTYRTTDTTEDSFGGIYHVQTTTTYSGSTLVNASPIFTDTRNDGLTSGVNQTQDQPTNAQQYYLFLKDFASINQKDFDLPAFVYDATGDIYTDDSAGFSTILEQMTRWTASHGVGGKISYQYVSGNAQRGVSILDTRLSSSTTSTQFFSADDYRAQTHPSGTATTANTYYLGITVT
jgi:hypothetical protein